MLTQVTSHEAISDFNLQSDFMQLRLEPQKTLYHSFCLGPHDQDMVPMTILNAVKEQMMKVRLFLAQMSVNRYQGKHPP